MKKLIVACIRFYQKHLTQFTPDCLYEPSCSEYYVLAIEKYGLSRGWKMFKERFNRCDRAHIHNYGMKDYP
ncbi:MAG: membrane protein insertion efficiency factor YidD [Bacteroidetes bacterium]|nr:membrane protein insertion efficiency factor YidD [Bacteroidota bacterium]MDA0943713.1 membrane protein insertion efficiency factor YidD [Bacteroidota bacterium]